VKDEQFARLKPGDIIIRKWDKSRWVVMKSKAEPRPDKGSQLIFGDIVTITLKRVSIDMIKTVEPLSWDLET